MRWPRPLTRAVPCWLRRVALVSGVLAASALASESARPPDASAGGGAVSSDGSYYVEWSPDPTPVPLNEMFVIHFKVMHADRRSSPVEGAVVTASAWMPSHNHGTPLQPRVQSHGDGTATATGFLLHMAGHWQLRVGVSADGRMERANFDLELLP